MNKKLWLTAAGFALVLLLASVGYRYLSAEYVPSNVPAADAAQDAAPEENAQTADFTVQDSAGESITLSDFFGKPIVVNFWATWCPPCRAELPSFDSAYAAYGEDVVFLMVNLTDGQRDTVESAGGFIADEGYAFPVYFDTEYDAANAYAVRSIPTTLFIDADGVLRDQHVGLVSEETLTAYLDDLLAPAETAAP